MKYHALDGLRGIFSILVVLFHFDVVYMPQDLFNQFWIRESYVLVDFFFLLSGFVISFHYTNRLNNWTDFAMFMRKRFKRIYPMLFFSSAVFLLFLCTSRFTNWNLTDMYNRLVAQSRDLLETLLLSNATPILGFGYGINYPSWTVSSEMISYLIFALICLSGTANRKRNIIALIFVSCFVFMWINKTYFYNFTWGFVRGLFSFLLGYFLVQAEKLNINIPSWTELFVLPVIFLLMYVLHAFDSSAASKQLFALFAVPVVFSACMLVMIKTRGIFSRWMELPLFQFLGQISYSTYLNHALVIMLLPWLSFQHFHFAHTAPNQILVILTCFAVLIGYSYVTYRMVEIRG